MRYTVSVRVNLYAQDFRHRSWFNCVVEEIVGRGSSTDRLFVWGKSTKATSTHLRYETYILGGPSGWEATISESVEAGCREFDSRQ